MRAQLSVLVVDDSAFFCHRLADLFNQATDMQVVGYASDGKMAVQMAHELRPDVITMDVHMPVLDGISAVRRIMGECPTPILMFSALTRQGAHETLEALEAGAVDFMPKDRLAPGDGSAVGGFTELFLHKVREVARSRLPLRRTAGSGYRTVSHAFRQKIPAQTGQLKLVAIGASTGGPVALQVILSSLPRHFSLPIVVAVHMPGSFTTAYAERLNTLSAVEVKEASDRDALRPGRVLIAPGGKQMLVEKGASGGVVRIKEALPGDVYHPSVDQLFQSSARIFGDQALGLILTGMGSDGLQGGRQMKASGAHIWSQDEKSCVVYGMPHAVAKAGLSDRVLTLDDMGPQLMKQQ